MEGIIMVYTEDGVTNLATPVLITPMSLRSAIPQWVAVQQGASASPTGGHSSSIPTIRQTIWGTYLDGATRRCQFVRLDPGNCGDAVPITGATRVLRSSYWHYAGR